jgi:integrase/DNA-binding CsgD family transcriptional regulator
MKIDQATKKLVREVADMVASNMTVDEIAKALGRSIGEIGALRTRYQMLWGREITRARQDRKINNLKAKLRLRPVKPKRDQEDGTCNSRDHLWMSWTDEGLGPAAIRDRWNAMSQQDRLKACPDRWQTATDRTVQMAITRARQAKGSRRRDSWAASLEPPDHTVKRIQAVTSLVAAGMTWQEIADELNISVGTIHYYADDCRSTWKAELDRSMQIACQLLRREAGTEAAMEKANANPRLFLRRASACQDWARANGKQLFPAGEEPTVTTFLENYVFPVRLAEASGDHKELYRQTADHWAFFTGDPPLKKITCELLARFKAFLVRSPGITRGTFQSPNTVRKPMRYLQMILDCAGPKDRRHRDCAGILSEAPWVKPPPIREKPVRFVAPELLSATYKAAVLMDRPRIDGMETAGWWQALLVLAYESQLRRRSLFELRMDEVKWDRALLDLPAERFKSRKGQRIHLNETALRHLQGIRSNARELVFPWPHVKKYFDTCFHRLQTKAGIPTEDHFGLHDLRKTAATLLWEDSPQAAQFALGHASMATTRNHYVNGAQMTARALDALPQPEAFIVGGDQTTV